MGASALGQMRQVTYPAAQHPTSQQEIVALKGVEPLSPEIQCSKMANYKPLAIASLKLGGGRTPSVENRHL